jgi:hypothetical protein
MASELSKFIEDELKSRGLEVEEEEALKAKPSKEKKKKLGAVSLTRIKSPDTAWAKENEALEENERTPLIPMLIPGTLIPAPSSSVGNKDKAKDKKTRKDDKDHQTLMGALRVEARVKVS